MASALYKKKATVSPEGEVKKKKALTMKSPDGKKKLTIRSKR